MFFPETKTILQSENNLIFDINICGLFLRRVFCAISDEKHILYVFYNDDGDKQQLLCDDVSGNNRLSWKHLRLFLKLK